MKFFALLTAIGLLTAALGAPRAEALEKAAADKNERVRLYIVGAF